MPEMLPKAKTHRHWLMLIPTSLAGLWFFLLEKMVTNPVYLLHARLDDYIPFVPLFVIPYVLWYFYIGAPAVFLFFKSPREFTRYAAFLTCGMVLACIVYTLFPNGQALRPALEADGGPLIDLIRLLYAVDTPANSAPSLHVIFSVAACAAITRYNKPDRRFLWVNAVSIVLAALCILSTVFIKQHSVIDLITGLLASGPLYLLVYGLESARVTRTGAYRVSKRARLHDNA